MTGQLEAARAARTGALQAAFAAALFDPEAPLPRGLAGSARAQQSRFDVYRNNVMSGLVRSLESKFPVIERLVGTTFFRAMAQVYVTEEPPRSPALIDYGEGFADFVAQFEPARELPYLPDVATLEWLRSRAYHAADAPHADAASLAALAGSDAGDLVIRLHPSARLFRSAHPVVSIWETNTRDDVVRDIGPDLPGEQTLIVRWGLEVRLVRLGAGGYSFAAALDRGAALAAAAEVAIRADPDVSIPHALAQLIAAGAVRDVSTASDLSNPAA